MIEHFPVEGDDERKKHCRVCGSRVTRLYKGSGGRRCVVCLHRTHGEHMAENNRVCLECYREELTVNDNHKEKPVSLSILHVSDLHLTPEGGEEPALLKNWIAARDIDYILISGDLTTKSAREEYEAAADWIRDVEQAGTSVAVVPGNHDIGYWGNPVSLGRHIVGKKYHWWIEIIDRPIEPCIRGPFFVSVGLNSAHGISPTRVVNGYLNRNQRERAREILKVTPADHLKVVFCHHPLVMFEKSFHKAMLRADEVRNDVIEAGADLLLWGHQHSFETTRIEKSGKKCIAVQSPTLSERIRDGHKNPGFVIVRWFFNNRALIDSYSIVDKSIIKEEKSVEYKL